MTDHLVYDTGEAYVEPPIPEGNYGVEIRGAEMIESERTGREAIRVNFIITDSGDYENRFLSDSLWLPMDEDRGQRFGNKDTDKFAGMLGMVGEKIKKVNNGSFWPKDGSFSVQEFMEGAIGMSLVVKVRHQTEDEDGNTLEQPREEVTRWYRVS